ncbi:dipicolinate synthase subunit DpsA [[Clostridium] colinum]|uniref:dipicolinate synthase subunit DpsA n=1 Tax=[Clostridium] colinum TaxID=36835 RepID=UPI0020257BF2|nr:dipicolinate synthase subunit DpsA [[Clostridium] colinum]
MVLGILGGDFRYKFLYEMLIDENLLVYVYNNKHIESENNIKSLDEFLKKIDILIVPIPFTKDNNTVFNVDNEILNIDVLLEKVINNNIKIFFGGVIGKDRINFLENNNIKVFDFFEDDSIAILNAIPTAEGAIQTAMQESFKTIFDSKCLVLGYGRCGKILANMLKGIGANIDVTYRKPQDLAYINAYGLNPINLYDITGKIDKYDFIFNTIPYEILDKNILSKINKDTVIIDLAQAPGGVDYTFARTLNLKAIYCPGLPARVAPYTAGKILKDKIIEYIKNDI